MTEIIRPVNSVMLHEQNTDMFIQQMLLSKRNLQKRLKAAERIRPRETEQASSQNGMTLPWKFTTWTTTKHMIRLKHWTYESHERSNAEHMNNYRTLEPNVQWSIGSDRFICSVVHVFSSEPLNIWTYELHECINQKNYWTYEPLNLWTL